MRENEEFWAELSDSEEMKENMREVQRRRKSERRPSKTKKKPMKRVSLRRTQDYDEF